jgi:hypothetical protein
MQRYDTTFDLGPRQIGMEQPAVESLEQWKFNPLTAHNIVIRGWILRPSRNPRWQKQGGWEVFEA